MLAEFLKGWLLPGYLRPVVVGRRLLPYSLGHAFCLRGLGCAYVVGGKVAPKDVILGAWVCSRDWAWLKDNVLAGDLDEAMRWGRRWRGEWRAEARRLGEYIDQYTAPLSRWEDCDADGHVKSEPVRAPGELHLLLDVLESGLARTEAEAWDTPYSKAVALRAVLAERAGDKSIVTDAEAERNKQIEEAKRRLMEQQAEVEKAGGI